MTFSVPELSKPNRSCPCQARGEGAHPWGGWEQVVVGGGVKAAVWGQREILGDGCLNCVQKESQIFLLQCLYHLVCGGNL